MKGYEVENGVKQGGVLFNEREKVSFCIDRDGVHPICTTVYN